MTCDNDLEFQICKLLKAIKILSKKIKELEKERATAQFLLISLLPPPPDSNLKMFRLAENVKDTSNIITFLNDSTINIAGDGLYRITHHSILLSGSGDRYTVIPIIQNFRQPNLQTEGSFTFENVTPADTCTSGMIQLHAPVTIQLVLDTRAQDVTVDQGGYINIERINDKPTQPLSCQNFIFPGAAVLTSPDTYLFTLNATCTTNINPDNPGVITGDGKIVKPPVSNAATLTLTALNGPSDEINWPNSLSIPLINNEFNIFLGSIDNTDNQNPNLPPVLINVTATLDITNNFFLITITFLFV
ncbi:MAG: hypothetical protein Hyperionvirus6_61 [Hyperionvirus sp.]|uniref:Uncharacterized protein n=1 Tax=Hyperionvirus sp. TaxID=2487770 RepID=A0A3G5A7X1_9VIRU|nr:MAG: hypothetical protein Hyperionvirus6_61 [Hyperionvirus sp.]